MAGQRIKVPRSNDHLAQIHDLEKTLLSEHASPHQRLSAAQAILNIGISHAWDSAERREAAQSLKKGWENAEPEITGKLRIMIDSLGFRIHEQRYTESKPEYGERPVIKRRYSLSELLEPPKSQPKPPKKEPQAAIESAKSPNETKPLETGKAKDDRYSLDPRRKSQQPRRIDLGIRDFTKPDSMPNPALSAPTTPDDRRRWEKGEREAKAAIMVPVSEDGRINQYIARIPKPTTPAGLECQRRIGRELIIMDARSRVQRTKAPPEPKEDFRDLPMSVSIWPPPWIASQRWWKIVNTPDVGGRIFTREPIRQETSTDLSGIGRKDILSPIDKQIVIACLDNDPSVNKRLKAIIIIMKHRMKEAEPLLKSIIDDPASHNADGNLIEAAEAALRFIRMSG